jgi:hypothetical protein
LLLLMKRTTRSKKKKERNPRWRNIVIRRKRFFVVVLQTRGMVRFPRFDYIVRGMGTVFFFRPEVKDSFRSTQARFSHDRFGPGKVDKRFWSTKTLILWRELSRRIPLEAWQKVQGSLLV